MKKHVVFIVIDALRADRLFSYGYSKRTTPNLDEYVKQGARFENVYTLGPYTRASFPVMMSSRHARELLVQETGKLAKDTRFRIMAELFKENGYITAGFSVNPYLSKEHGYQRGFDYYDDSLSWFFLKDPTSSFGHLTARIFNRCHQRITGLPKLNDRISLKKALAWIRQNRKSNSPFFLFLHLLGVHGPYCPGKDSLQKLGFEPGYSRKVARNLFKKVSRDESFCPEPVEVELLTRLYEGSIREVDLHLGNFIKAVKACAQEDDTLFVVTSDHGELLGEHGLYSHPGVFYEDLVRVPLLLFPLEGVKDGCVTDTVTTLDLLPTMLDVAGIDPNAYDFRGNSLLPLLDGGGSSQQLQGAVFFDGAPNKDFKRAAIIWKGFKYWLDENRKEEFLFHLEEDPMELENLVDSEKFLERKEELKALLMEHLDGLTPPSESGLLEGPEEIDESMKERLVGLGYLDD